MTFWSVSTTGWNGRSGDTVKVDPNGAKNAAGSERIVLFALTTVPLRPVEQIEKLDDPPSPISIFVFRSLTWTFAITGFFALLYAGRLGSLDRTGRG